MTIVFNVFVVYTLFNQVNCRVIDDHLNILVRIGNNLFFPIITLSELCLQIILIEFGGDAFKCTERGLTLIQWLICIGFSAITFLLSAIIKFIPLDVCIQRCLDNISRDNKVAGEEELSDEKGKEEKEKLNMKEKNELNNSKISKNTKVDNSKEEELNGSLLRSLKMNSNITSGGRDIRKEKPNIIISVD